MDLANAKIQIFRAVQPFAANLTTMISGKVDMHERSPGGKAGESPETYDFCTQHDAKNKEVFLSIE